MAMKIKKYLGVDWGEKRIGLALGDGENKVAVPFKVVGSIEEIVRVAKEEKVDMIALGKPIKMSADEGTMPDEFKAFTDVLKKKSGIPVWMVDERLTSKAADALSRDKKARAPRDAVAAMLILQSYLDQL